MESLVKKECVFIRADPFACSRDTASVDVVCSCMQQQTYKYNELFCVGLNVADRAKLQEQHEMLKKKFVERGEKLVIFQKKAREYHAYLSKARNSLDEHKKALKARDGKFLSMFQ